MFGTRFIALGAAPSFFGRLRTWFRQTFVVDFQVAEILGPVPVIAKEQEVKLINVPVPLTVSSTRAQGLKPTPAQSSTTTTSSAPWMEMAQMGPLTLSQLRRQIRRRKGWYNLRQRHQLQANKEERTGLLAAAEVS